MIYRTFYTKIKNNAQRSNVLFFPRLSENVKIPHKRAFRGQCVSVSACMGAYSTCGNSLVCRQLEGQVELAQRGCTISGEEKGYTAMRAVLELFE